MQPGRYYLTVYHYPDKKENYSEHEYTINVNGPIQTAEKINTIVSLEQLQDLELKVGEQYTLPATIKATMNDGSVQDMAVTWNDTVDASKVGEYSLEGTIEGTDLKAVLKVIVNKLNNGNATKDYINAESEPNNSFDKANGAIVSDVSVSGNLNKDDNIDMFYFDVKSEGDIDITVKNNGNSKMNWLLYRESDHDNHVAYAQEGTDELKGKYHAKPGRYYLKAYMYEGDTASYTVDVSGDIGTADTSSNENFIKVESEPNNSFEKANGAIVSDVRVSGNLNKDDNKDIFYFDVKSEGDIDITVKNNSNSKMNWLLYSESDHDNHVAYAQEGTDELKGKYHAKPGRYYLKAYMYEGDAASYTVDVKGDLNKN
ncbi:Ig-like domain-containing protein [Clostridium sp. ZS2-4]|nr:Ig-like domain-containing protein [Clostridium sp. ZS2-4]